MSECVAVLAACSTALAAACSHQGQTPPAARAVTFNTDIAPIVYTSCAPCHRPGQVAPFPLLSYTDVIKHAQSVSEQTRTRQMPPWLPEPGDFPIVGERRLHPDQIDAIQQWIKAGMPEGHPGDAPAAPRFPDGWELGQPDIVLTPSKPYTLRPGGEDVYRDLVLRTSITAPVYVRAVEFKTNGAPIHHAVIRVDATGASERRDGADGQPGFNGMAVQSVQDPGGQFIGWAPGRGPILSPDGMPWQLTPGSDLVIELHMLAPKTPQTIQPTVGLFLTSTPPVRTPVTVLINALLIDIPAGDPNYVVTETAELPVGVELLGVYPHAHYLGKEMQVTAALPDGTTKTLLQINHWSFHWQQDYRYVTPIVLPAGTKVTMRYTYDNSDGNRENPHHPPARVRLGPNSTDEMGELGLQVLTASLADSAKLIQYFDDRDAQAAVALWEKRVGENPGSAEAEASLGASYVDVGRTQDARGPLERALQLNPRLAGAHSNLATVLMTQGNAAAAIEHLERAATLQPNDATIWFNLGNALRAVSQPGQAVAAYGRALKVDPEYADAMVNLATVLFTRGRVAESIPYFARASQLRPNSAVIHTDYGSALAAAGHYADALREIRRALEINPDYPPARDTLEKLARVGVR